MIGVFAPYASTSAQTADRYLEFLQDYLREHPSAEIPDIYKLIHQEYFGVGHYIPDSSSAHLFLTEELTSVSADNSHPLISFCGPDSIHVRVHLQRFKNTDLRPQLLIRAMLHSMKHTRNDTAAFAVQWKRVGEYIAARELPFTHREYEAFTLGVRSDGYPPVHHSKSYRIKYKPAYRVVHRVVFEKYFGKFIVRQ